jgi:L-amino acid N-acyltransferase YncA
MERGGRYALWPIFMSDTGWSVPDELLAKLWEKMVEEGRAASLFYDGRVKDEAEWIAWLKAPGNYPVIVMDAREKKIAAIGWLNNVDKGAAQIHFCMYGLPDPRMGVKVLEYYSKFPGLHVIVGVTPEHYETAIRYAKRIGFTETGRVPNMLHMAYEQRRAGAVITYYEVGR